MGDGRQSTVFWASVECCAGVGFDEGRTIYQSIDRTCLAALGIFLELGSRDVVTWF